MPKRILQGTIVSVAGDKSVVVCVERRVQHPVFKKFVRRSKKYMAHDASNACAKGDEVRIRECRPISRRKTWEVVTESEKSRLKSPVGDWARFLKPERII